MDSTQLVQHMMKSFCRICAQKNTKLIPIFDHKMLVGKIHKCLPIQVTVNDHLPVSICEMCLLKVDESYLLYESCLYADQKLKRMWKSFLKLKNHSDQEAFLDTDEMRANLIHFDSLANENIDCIETESGVILTIDAQGVTTIQGDASEKAIQERTVYSNIEILNSHESSFTTEVQQSKESVEEECLISKDRNDIEEYKEEDDSKQAYKTKQVTRGKGIPLKQSASVKTYNCRFCTRQLPTLASLSVHESTHSQEKPFLCDSCGKSFKHANNLRSHVRTHLAIRKKFICKICNKSFLSNFFLQEHMNSHTGETPYKCTECGKEFREKVHLRQHKWTHSSNKFVCSVCGAQFNRKGNMSEHIKKFHLQGDAEAAADHSHKKEEASSHPCPVCAHEATTEILLKQHIKTHTSEQCYFCALCGKQFRHSGSLTYHRRTAHTGERPFQCSYCDEKFSLRSVQHIHERKKHTHEKPYKCSFCPSLFTNSSSLKNHSFVHAKEKLFECDECGKKFSRSSNLFVHKKLHSGDRQFTCDECGKSYIQKHDMLKHKKIHDPKKKPFFCKFCGNSFAHKKDFAKHALCQINFTKRNNVVDVCSAEKILDSVTSVFQKEAKTLFEAERLILESVEQFSNEKLERDVNEGGIDYYVDKETESEAGGAAEVFMTKPD